VERKAFKMRLRAGCEAEYRKRHDEIWPELARLLSEAGISDYSIFLDPGTLSLFAVQKLAPGHRSESLPDEPLMRRWWDHMKDLMFTNPDGSPVCEELSEVFHLE
jgi:L-rhamnose mutarotase